MKGRMTPLFGGGVAIVILDMRPWDAGRGCFKADNHSGMSQIEESGFAAFLDLSAGHPPLSPCQALSATVHKKSADSASLSADLILIRKAHGPPCPTLVNRDSFPDVGIGHSVEHSKPPHGSVEAAVGS